jgi:predicted small secreted protein
MTATNSTSVIAAIFVIVALSSCGNTIRGAGKDTANAVDATEDAARRVGKAAD